MAPSFGMSELLKVLRDAYPVSLTTPAPEKGASRYVKKTFLASFTVHGFRVLALLQMNLP